MSAYLHALEGRLRIKLSDVKGSSHDAREVARRMRGIRGVERATANPLTGNLLVVYDAAETNGGAAIRVRAPIDLGRALDARDWAAAVRVLDTYPEIATRVVSIRPRRSRYVCNAGVDGGPSTVRSAALSEPRST